MGHLLSDPCQGSGITAEEEGEDREEGEEERGGRGEGDQEGEEFNGSRTGKSTMKYYLLDKAWLLYTQTHSSHGYLHQTCPQ